MSETSIGFGPLARIEGPPPSPPRHGLLQAAAAPAAGVRLVPDAEDRWINGVEVEAYPVSMAEVWDACRSGSAGAEKADGDPHPSPQFGAMTVYLADTCTRYQVPDESAFRARAATVMQAVEGAAVEREFLTGDDLLLNPHLSDGNGEFPNADAPTSPVNGIALLEQEIARSGRLGLIHISPMLAVVLGAAGAISELDGVLRTTNGTPVISGAGYAEGATPKDGHANPAANQEWAYATGPIDVRRSEIFIVPDTLAEALDRGMGATHDRPNAVTYYVERYYLVDWDTDVQAAVLIDRCSDEC